MNKTLNISTVFFMCVTIFFSVATVLKVQETKKRMQDATEQLISGSVVGDKDYLNKVKSEFQKIESEEDKILMHKLWTGAYLYLKNTEGISHTAQFDPILGRVQSAYNWKRDKYPEFTNALSDYLVSEGYDEPRELKTRSDRLWLAEIFKGLMEATKYE